MKLVKVALWVAVLVLFNSGCVPTITKVYQSPKVMGQVIDLASLKPIEGVHVAHHKTTEQFVTTDINGKFSLPSKSVTDYKPLMAGHALNDNLVTLYNQSGQFLLVASATLNSQIEETVDLSTIIFDSNPKSIAPPAKSSYLKYNQLRTYFYPHSLLGQCDKDLSFAALVSLNTSRKLIDTAASLAKSHEKSDEKLAAEYLQLASTNYQTTVKLWSTLKPTCNRTNKNYLHVDEVFKTIEQESQDFNQRS